MLFSVVKEGLVFIKYVLIGFAQQSNKLEFVEMLRKTFPRGGNVINLRCFRRGRYPHRPFQTLRIRRSMVPKGYHSPRGDVGIAPYGAVVDA